MKSTSVHRSPSTLGALAAPHPTKKRQAARTPTSSCFLPVVPVPRFGRPCTPLTHFYADKYESYASAASGRANRSKAGKLPNYTRLSHKFSTSHGGPHAPFHLPNLQTQKKRFRASPSFLSSRGRPCAAVSNKPKPLYNL